MAGIFRFKQFDVDQSGCGMKINTDGVLLGALASADSPEKILDIGTGTGVIALMLAQRFGKAQTDAVEIDKEAAVTAGKNFRHSRFAERLHLYGGSFRDYFKNAAAGKYDLIVSNPPFFLNSLKNTDRQKHTARHTDHNFFSDMLSMGANHLNKDGHISLILPPETAAAITTYATTAGLYVEGETAISSFPDAVPHRQIITFGFNGTEIARKSFVIYQREKQYSAQYQQALKDFFTIF